jgi:clan AA aspartic protease (TIGR02281 family)
MFRPGIVLVGFLLLAPSVRGDGPTAEETLKAKGLRRSETYYVLPAEADVSKRINTVRSLFKDLSFAAAQQRAFEQDTSDRKGLIQMMTQQRIALNQQLAQVSSVEENNRLVAMIQGISDRLDLLRQGANDPKLAEDVRANVSQKREAYVQAILDLRQVVDKTTDAYAALAEDEEVKGSLAALNLKTKAKRTLGPSRVFRDNVKALEKAEAAVLTDTVEMRGKGGVHWVDVTLNGKVTRSFVFDTGAALITLPADLAAQAGLRPTSSDPIVRLRTADGSLIEAKQMKLATVRVGRFTVEDVTCAIMPADKGEVDPLLGGSFLRNFTYKLHPDQSKLILTEVEVPGASPARPKIRSTAPATKGGRTPPRPKGQP